MGYYSQVKIIFYSNNPEDYPMVKLWVEQNYAPPKQYGFELEEFEIGKHKCIGYENDSMKWYEDYDPVSAVLTLKQKFEDTFSGTKTPLVSGCYEFVRIGEELTDMEQESWNNDDFLLSIDRYIRED